MTNHKDLYVLLDSSGYVINACRQEISNYTLYGKDPYPQDIINGCYKLIDGEFVLDQEKYDSLYDEFGNSIHPPDYIPNP